MEKAIKRSIEGGYEYNCGKGMFDKGDGMKCTFSGVNRSWTVWTRIDNDSSICVSHENTLLDPEFWKCLGKARGWVKSMPSTYNFNDEMPEWRHHWHRFIDHLAEGKPDDEFFINLLK